jgi:hypothetical protein
MNVQLTHPEEKRVYALGQKMFFYRGGAYDFACATCQPWMASASACRTSRTC